MKSEDNDQKRRSAPDIGLGGVSLEEFMDQFNEDMEPDHTAETSLSSAAQVEIITERGSTKPYAAAASGQAGDIRPAAAASGQAGDIVRPTAAASGQAGDIVRPTAVSSGQAEDIRPTAVSSRQAGDIVHAAPVTQQLFNEDEDSSSAESETRVWQPDDEVRQQLVIGRDGSIVFRSLKYFKGKGHYSIGRYETVQIAPGTAKEIYQLLDTWLFVSRPQNWNPDSDAGSWLLRVRHEDGPTGIERGSLIGAFVDGIDVSSFIRQRVPIAGLLLFDP